MNVSLSGIFRPARVRVAGHVSYMNVLCVIHVRHVTHAWLTVLYCLAWLTVTLYDLGEAVLQNRCSTSLQRVLQCPHHIPVPRLNWLVVRDCQRNIAIVCQAPACPRFHAVLVSQGEEFGVSFHDRVNELPGLLQQHVVHVLCLGNVNAIHTLAKLGVERVLLGQVLALADLASEVRPAS